MEHISTKIVIFRIFVYEFENVYTYIIQEPGPKGKEAEKLGLQDKNVLTDTQKFDSTN